MKSKTHMKHLFEDWKHVRDEIRRARTLFLFFDYDGTLTPIVSRPELALCPSEVGNHLERLRELPGVSLAIISGRSLQDLRQKVGVSGIFYVGNHGLEVEYPDGSHKKMILSPAKKRELKRITQNLKAPFEEISGIIFEEKGPILAVHYRNVSQRYHTVILRTVEKELQQWKGRWKVASGKRVSEIQPDVDFSKGKAVRELLRTFPSPGPLQIYLGDDQTDEDAFRVLKGQGISVFIGPAKGPSEADYFLKDPGEVDEFLFRCHRLRRMDGDCPGTV